MLLLKSCYVVGGAGTVAAPSRVAAAVGSGKGAVGGGGGSTSTIADVAVAEECCASVIAE